MYLILGYFGRACQSALVEREREYVFKLWYLEKARSPGVVEGPARRTAVNDAGCSGLARV
jgi:hypothetical protein